MHRIVWPLCIFLLVLIGVLNQPTYPKTWFDEGLALQGAFNLAENGQYAMRSSEGFRILDQPLIANGPGLVVPIALVFQFFGAGLLQARILMAVYFAMTVVLFYRVSSILFKPVAALLSVLILFAVPAEGFILYGRQALGNVPAFLYFLAGILFFYRTAEGRSLRDAIFSGLFFGFALVTKGQYWTALLCLGITLLADLFQYKKLGTRNGITILAVMIASLLLWQGVQFCLVGPENYPQHLAGISSSAKVSVFAFRAERIPGSVWYLIRSGFPLFILPGLIAAGLGARRRTIAGLVQLFLVVFLLVWLAWYAFASVGWPRYAFEAYAAGSLLAGQGMIQLFRMARETTGESFSPPLAPRLVRGASIVLLLAAVLWGIQAIFKQAASIVSYSDAAPLEIASYIRENIASTAVIESWEWEVDILAPGNTFHHPANVWVDQKTAELQFGDPFDGGYDPLSFAPSYLIDGPFSKFTYIYSGIISRGCCVPVVTVGEYTLYRIGSQ